jgi:hypothetical protein
MGRVMYRFGDIFTCDSYEFIDGEGDHYYKCTLIKDVGGYSQGDMFEYIWFDRSEVKLWFCMVRGGGYIMCKCLTTVD